MSNEIILRPARRSDIPDLARVGNAANAKSALHKRMAPYQDKYPLDYYQWRLDIVRQRLAAPDTRTIVAEDSLTGEILGQASWAVEGTETALYKEWASEYTWLDWLEGKMVSVQKSWSQYFADRSIDHQFLTRFMSAFLGSDRAARPPCLHLHMIVVAPNAQSRGVGRMLVDWGKDLAMKEDLPVFLEATLEATGFYEKGGFSRLGHDVLVSPDGQDPLYIPAFAWEGEGREGRWLEHDASEGAFNQRWKWKDDVLSQ